MLKVKRRWAERMQIRYVGEPDDQFVTLPGVEIMKELDERAIIRLENGHTIWVPYDVILNGQRGVEACLGISGWNGPRKKKAQYRRSSPW